jgi:hypothetical protein
MTIPDDRARAQARVVITRVDHCTRKMPQHFQNKIGSSLSNFVLLPVLPDCFCGLIILVASYHLPCFLLPSYIFSHRIIVISQILRSMTRGMKLDGDFDFAAIARKCAGFAGADLAALAKEAAVFAVNRIFSDMPPLLEAPSSSPPSGSGSSSSSPVLSKKKASGMCLLRGNSLDHQYRSFSFKHSELCSKQN